MATFLRIYGAVFLVFLSLLPARAEMRTAEVLKEEQASKTVLLPDLINPTGIHVDGGRIFITEESSVAIYSADDLRLLKKFGRRGEGPGEFKYPPYLIPQASHLLILNFDRIFNYSLEGELLEERKIPLNYNYWIFPLLPVGEKYIGFPIEPIEGVGFGHIGRLYNQEFQPIKKVYDTVPSLVPHRRRDRAKRAARFPNRIWKPFLTASIWLWPKTFFLWLILGKAFSSPSLTVKETCFTKSTEISRKSECLKNSETLI